MLIDRRDIDRLVDPLEEQRLKNLGNFQIGQLVYDEEVRKKVIQEAIDKRAAVDATVKRVSNSIELRDYVAEILNHSILNLIENAKNIKGSPNQQALYFLNSFSSEIGKVCTESINKQTEQKTKASEPDRGMETKPDQMSNLEKKKEAINLLYRLQDDNILDNKILLALKTEDGKFFRPDVVNALAKQLDVFARAGDTEEVTKEIVVFLTTLSRK